jgi:hypothetical protein
MEKASLINESIMLDKIYTQQHEFLQETESSV